ncbi:hypothetical protein Tco_0157119 [Tanacetum coccineum]
MKKLERERDGRKVSSDRKKERILDYKTNEADESDMDLFNDNPHGDDDAARYGVFMHNKSTATPNSTYLSQTVTSSSLDFIQTLLDETLVNELTDFMSASEVPLGTHVDVLVTKTLMHEMFPYENAHHIPSIPAKKISYHTTTPQPSSLQAKAKKLMQKAKNNMRKFNFKKAVAQKFKEYDQNKKKRRKDVVEPSSRSSRRNRSRVVLVQDDTPAMQSLDKADTLIQKHSNP